MLQLRAYRCRNSSTIDSVTFSGHLNLATIFSNPSGDFTTLLFSCALQNTLMGVGLYCSIFPFNSTILNTLMKCASRLYIGQIVPIHIYLCLSLSPSPRPLSLSPPPSLSEAPSLPLENVLSWLKYILPSSLWLFVLRSMEQSRTLYATCTMDSNEKGGREGKGAIMNYSMFYMKKSLLIHLQNT